MENRMTEEARAFLSEGSLQTKKVQGSNPGPGPPNNQHIS